MKRVRQLLKNNRMTNSEFNMTPINKTKFGHVKKLILTIAIIAISFSSYAQKNSIFDKFEDYDDVTTVVVTQKAFNMLGKISNDSEEGKEFNNLVKGLNNLKVFTTENAKIAGEMQATFDKYLSKAKLSELMRVKDKDANVKIYVREGKDDDHVSEFLMLVNEVNASKKHDGKHGNPEVVIISLTGDIDLNNISKLTKEMNIPGGEHMEKAEKK